MNNPLLSRKQMVLDILHPNTRAPSTSEVRTILAKTFRTTVDLVVVHKLYANFGGGRSCAEALIYDSIGSLKKVEPKYRQIRNGIMEKVKSSRKMRKERKNRMKKVRGTAKSKVGATAPSKKAKK